MKLRMTYKAIPVDEFIHLQYEEWLAMRPPKVRRVLEEFPPQSIVEVDGVPYFVLGANEDGMLIVSDVDPSEDYDRAVGDSHRKYVCMEHLQS